MRIVTSTIKHCSLWPRFKQLKLTRNMRADADASQFHQYFFYSFYYHRYFNISDGFYMLATVRYLRLTTTSSYPILSLLLEILLTTFLDKHFLHKTRTLSLKRRYYVQLTTKLMKLILVFYNACKVFHAQPDTLLITLIICLHCTSFRNRTNLHQH